MKLESVIVNPCRQDIGSSLKLSGKISSYPVSKAEHSPRSRLFLVGDREYLYFLSRCELLNNWQENLLAFCEFVFH